MGSAADEPFAKPDEHPPVRVTLTQGFWLGKTMVTIGQWKSVTGSDNSIRRLNAIEEEEKMQTNGLPPLEPRSCEGEDGGYPGESELVWADRGREHAGDKRYMFDLSRSIHGWLG